MNGPDFITILGNLSQSLVPVQRLITGGAYILGTLFFITAIAKFRKIADQRAQSSSHDSMFSPIMYMLFGGILLYLPSAMNVMANTAFGVGNVLTYTNYNKYDVYGSMGILIRTGGVLWFVRGCVLIVHASEPGAQEGPKGLAFLVAGVLAMNFDNTISMVNYVLDHLMALTMTIKKSQGY